MYFSWFIMIALVYNGIAISVKASIIDIDENK